MKVTMLLADAAQESGGKLYILGGGWSITDPKGAPMALAIKIEVPWDEANEHHLLRLELVDEDGQQVQMPADAGGGVVELRSSFEVGRQTGLRRGRPLDVPLALNFAPMPLQPNSGYTWRCYINDHLEDEVTFYTRPVPPGAPA